MRKSGVGSRSIALAAGVIFAAGSCMPRALRDPLDGYVPPKLDGVTDKPFRDREACWAGLFDDTNQCIDSCLHDSGCIADCWARHENGARRCRSLPGNQTS